MTDLREVTALEAARILGVNERTIRMWIDKGRLLATKAIGQSRLRIPISEIHRIQAERAEREQLAELPTVRQLTERLARLESRLYEQQDARAEDQERIAALERQLADQAAQIAHLLEQIQTSGHPRAAHRQRHDPTRESDEAADHANIPELAPDLVGAAEFAETHGINVTTAKSAYQSGRIPTRRGKWRGPGRNPISVALDAEGRARFHQLYAGHRDFIRACPDCQE